MTRRLLYSLVITLAFLACAIQRRLCRHTARYREVNPQTHRLDLVCLSCAHRVPVNLR